MSMSMSMSMSSDQQQFQQQRSQPAQPAQQPAATRPAVNEAYRNCAVDYATENAARIDLMDALQSLEHTMTRLDLASRTSASVAEELGHHYLTLEEIRAAIERRLKS